MFPGDVIDRARRMGGIVLGVSEQRNLRLIWAANNRRKNKIQWAAERGGPGLLRAARRRTNEHVPSKSRRSMPQQLQRVTIVPCRSLGKE
ncbi:hypothetical protein EVAR_59708_1 [Eumeta japonica]|uniref:Uncharacterized protein n=1 Tax=Eumeta variegata TaxID=151549 RepID=A0A4C1XLI2_EUMVA|nr:hypothetical protein EVAR_59708_1 [Eumeta japonica]